MNELKLILKRDKPEIFFINEFNLDFNQDINLVNVKGYNIELDSLYIERGIARTAAYIKKNIVYQRLNKFENPGQSIIALKVGYPNKNKINVIGYYRQWSDTFNFKKFKKISISQQNIKFENQMKTINNLMDKDNETILMGDFNFDFNSIGKTENEKTQTEKKFNQMYKSIINNLFTKNMIQIVKNNTRENKILDHIYVNKINKIKNTHVIDDSFSDHSILSVSRSMSISKVEETLLIVRNLKNIDYYKLENNIYNNKKYLETLNENDTNIIAENIIEIILEEYNKLAPSKKIKLKNDEKDNISKATNILIDKKIYFIKRYMLKIKIH